MIRFVQAIIGGRGSRRSAPEERQGQKWTRPFSEGLAKLAQSRRIFRRYVFLSIAIAVIALGLSIAVSTLAAVYADPGTDEPVADGAKDPTDGSLSPIPTSPQATAQAEASAIPAESEGGSADAGSPATGATGVDLSALAEPVCASDALVPVPTVQPTPPSGRAPGRSATPVPTVPPPSNPADARGASSGPPGKPATREPPATPTRTPPTPTPASRPKPPPTPRTDPKDDAKNWVPTGRIKNANITFYDCYVDDFCGHMFNGITVYEGAAACSWNLGIGTRFRIVGDPTQRAYRCDDRGLLSNTWVDIFFWDPSDGWDWQAKVGRCATLEILMPRPG